MTNCCIVCGDDVEKEHHQVCIWHALTCKNEQNEIIYETESEYALKSFCSIDSYLCYVKRKKENILEDVFHPK